MNNKITYEKWNENRNEAIELVNKYPEYLKKRTTKGNFTGDYFSWLVVWRWMKKNYPNFGFETKEIQIAQDGTSGYVKASLYIDNEKVGTLALNLESFKTIDDKTKSVKITNETAEQLQMRVFVKLVANVTGFGIHLWEKGLK